MTASASSVFFLRNRTVWNWRIGTLPCSGVIQLGKSTGIACTLRRIGTAVSITTENTVQLLWQSCGTAVVAVILSRTEISGYQEAA